MNIDDLKRELEKRCTQQPIKSKHKRGVGAVEMFVENIKKQDKEDKRYMIKQRFLPLLIGLLVMVTLILLNPIKNIILMTGSAVITVSLFVTLVLYFLDFRNISRESFDLSLVEFLNQKERRLKSWRVTHFKYNLTFVVFQIGLLMMILGNESLIKNFSILQVILFLVCIFTIMFISWLFGEHFFRERHIKKHQPLLKVINELKDDLKRD
jgi:predicted permease